jgi:hypothetical protein
MKIKSEYAPIAAFAIVTTIAVAAFAYEMLGKKSIFFMICVPAGLVSGYAFIFARDRFRIWWSAHSKAIRLIALCVPAGMVWFMVFVPRKGPDRALNTSLFVGAILMLWLSYKVFSRAVDFLWARIRRH